MTCPLDRKINDSVPLIVCSEGLKNAERFRSRKNKNLFFSLNQIFRIFARGIKH